MIQFNLLPDVKMEYIKAKRLKRLMVTVSILAAGGLLTVAVLLFLGVNVVQKKHLNDLSKDLTSDATKLQNTPNIDKIITVQNQLTSLTTLHDSKTSASRLFDYLAQVTPSNVSIANVSADYAASTLTIGGAGKDFVAVNTFVDTLKFTTFTSDKDATKSGPAFTKVLLTSFSSGDKGSTYQVSLSFDPALFDSLQKISLAVPKTITTRSQISQPTELFQRSPTTKTGGQ